MRKTIHRPAALAAFGIAAALVLGACGSDGGSDSEKASGTADSAPAAATSEGAGGGGAELAVEAREFSFTPKDLTTSAGNVTIKLTNGGAIQHTLLIEGVGGLKLDVMSKGDTDDGSVELKPGTYTIYCDVPGHRSAGMEAKLTVS